MRQNISIDLYDKPKRNHFNQPSYNEENDLEWNKERKYEIEIGNIAEIFEEMINLYGIESGVKTGQDVAEVIGH